MSKLESNDKDNYERTAANCIDLQHQLEELKQELHAVNKKYNSKLALEKDTFAEIEELQSNFENEKQNRRYDNLKYEEETRKKELQWKNEIEGLKVEYEENVSKFESKIASLEEELSHSKKSAQSEGSKIKELKENLNCLTELLELEVGKREEAEIAAKTFEDKSKIIQQRLATAEERLQVKEDEVENLKEKLTSAIEDAALYCSQLQEMRAPLSDGKDSKPADPCLKGNSLFAEVDDRRQVMKQQLLNERKKYSKLQRAIQVKCSHVQNLEAQLIEVSRKWKDDVLETSSSKDNLITSFKAHIKDLEEKIERLQNQTNKFTVDGEFSGRVNLEPWPEFKRMEMDLEKERKEVKELREKLESVSLERIMQDQEIYEIKGKLRRLRAENAYLLRISEENKTKGAEIRGNDSKEGLQFSHHLWY